MNKEANLVQLNLTAASVAMGPADGAWERQLLAGQQQLQMAAQLCASSATVGARTNEKSHPRPF